MTIALPPMTDAQTAGRHALLQVHERLPRSWTLVGGQMAADGVATLREILDA